MKKKCALLFVLCYLLAMISSLNVHAAESSDYLSYSEIMLSSGKLIRYYTESELSELYSHLDGVHWIEVVVHLDNKSVDGSYIANTLYSVSNTSTTSIEYTLEYDVETNNKVSFQTSGSLSAGASGTIKKVKAECSAKASVDYSETTTKSVKEKKNMKFEIEPNSMVIVYLTGEVTVTNGAAAVYYWWVKAYQGAFEFVTLKSQFARMEKRSL